MAACAYIGRPAIGLSESSALSRWETCLSRSSHTVWDGAQIVEFDCVSEGCSEAVRDRAQSGAQSLVLGPLGLDSYRQLGPLDPGLDSCRQVEPLDPGLDSCRQVGPLDPRTGLCRQVGPLDPGLDSCRQLYLP
ncbi:hypothetical protein PoB_002989100 [Plakobranchus ocellatus]|uniref:Uncharacterized protein n=1 Tax=Plakobranchus ocellatus TaxID=259542 RepID=A0AAV3ZWQ0_9GAST|nr:hypothetical protein PoB_002989100 [Plakobranchus ocellatus]